MLSLTDISKNFSLYLSWTFTVLTSFVRLKQASLCILFWPCWKNPHILFVRNCWKSLKVFCLCECLLASHMFTVSLSQFQTWVIRMFLLATLCRLACYKFSNVIFGVNNLQAYNSNDFDRLFLTAVMITCKESFSIELDTSSTHSSSVVPRVAITPQLTAKLISFLVNRDASFLVLSLPEFTQPTFHFTLVFICAIYFVITPEFSSSSFLAQGEQLLLCPLSINSLHLLSKKIVLLNSGNHTSN